MTVMVRGHFRGWMTLLDRNQGSTHTHKQVGREVALRGTYSETKQIRGLTRGRVGEPGGGWAGGRLGGLTAGWEGGPGRHNYACGKTGTIARYPAFKQWQEKIEGKVKVSVLTWHAESTAVASSGVRGVPLRRGRTTKKARVAPPASAWSL